jgi:uncharacterized membrane protein YgcG
MVKETWVSLLIINTVALHVLVESAAQCRASSRKEWSLTNGFPLSSKLPFVTYSITSYYTYPSFCSLRRSCPSIINGPGWSDSDLLGVDPGASDNDIKKAYRKSALKNHPDKGGDPEVFKELTHAWVVLKRGMRWGWRFSYEVLSDDNKRAVYDQAGKAGLEGGGGMGGGGGMDPQDLFSQLFGGGGGFFGGGGGGSELPETSVAREANGRLSTTGTPKRQGPLAPNFRFSRGPLQGQSPETRSIQIRHL